MKSSSLTLILLLVLYTISDTLAIYLRPHLFMTKRKDTIKLIVMQFQF